VSLSDRDYQRLLAFRTELRRFQRWSEVQAEALGVTPAHHQLLLVIRGHVGAAAPTIGEVASHLMLRHHSAVELVDRAEAAGLVRRVSGGDDRRVVRLVVTAAGEGLLAELAAAHLEELRRLAPRIKGLCDGLATQPRGS
jgi:DNA-binding MarR family transcriptional regulator